MNDNIHIALLMMVKNEHKRLHVTLNSILDNKNNNHFIKSMVIYDTGSTDNTIQILKDFSNKHNIELRLKEGEFVDFSTSRNVSLDFADSFDDIDYLLLMDTNDELRGGDALVQFAKETKNNKDIKDTCFLVCQEWFSGKHDKYYNSRFIKSKSGWRYKGRVHEYLCNKNENGFNPGRVPDTVVLYQDRTQDDDKSGKRFAKDKIMLLEDFKDNPNEPRITFYLAQTCSSINHLDEAFYYYKIRSTIENGFWEERFHAYLRCGEISQSLKQPWKESLSWYMMAAEYTERAEPLVKIATKYLADGRWFLAYTFIDAACRLKYPDKSTILFVDKQLYDYIRWHLLGVIGYHAKHYENGKLGCLKAIESGIKNEKDNEYLKLYENLIKSEEKNKKVNETKKDYINRIIRDLKLTNPKMTTAQLENKSRILWKLNTKKENLKL
jgi:glycosyltransferase involved in cell wall biosynthesis